jgi:hypothetical protein
MGIESLIETLNCNRYFYLGRGGYGRLDAHESAIDVAGGAFIGYTNGCAGHGVLSLTVQLLFRSRFAFVARSFFQQGPC